MTDVSTSLHSLFGIGVDARSLGIVPIVLRALLIFFAALVMLRLADKRSFARKSAFDIVLAFVLGSTLARAINGSSPLLPTIIAGFVLVVLHRAMSFAARLSPWFSALIKGNSYLVIENGRTIEHALRSHNLTTGDLIEDLRLKGSTNDPAEVTEAWIERNGDLSVVKKKSPDSTR
jgi:uncharacterized membrane protein YcaP (DUF421 family)